MKIDLDKLKARSTSFDDYLSAQLAADAEFRAYWERTTFARALAIEVIRARATLDLSQTDLATRLDVPLDVVEALEEGEDDPSLETLRLLAERLGMQFSVSISLIAPDDASEAPPTLHTHLKQSAA